MSTEYVLGFLFNADRSEVACVLKARPEWQRGLYNGIGGHIEANEVPHRAMAREGYEEAGLPATTQWERFAVMRRELTHPTFICHVFRAVVPVEHLAHVVKSCESDQPVHVLSVSGLPSNVLSNLRWLIPMAADFDVADGNVYETVATVGVSRQRGLK